MIRISFSPESPTHTLQTQQKWALLTRRRTSSQHLNQLHYLICQPGSPTWRWMVHAIMISSCRLEGISQVQFSWTSDRSVNLTHLLLALDYQDTTSQPNPTLNQARKLYHSHPSQHGYHGKQFDSSNRVRSCDGSTWMPAKSTQHCWRNC